MKVYIGTLIEKCADGQLFIQTHAAKSAIELAMAIEYALRTEENERGIDIPRDVNDIKLECSRDNQSWGGDPLSIGDDIDLTHEFLLSTKIVDL